MFLESKNKLRPEIRSEAEKLEIFDFRTDGNERARKLHAELIDSPNLPSDLRVSVCNQWVLNPHTAVKTRIRIYRPKSDGILPCLYWIHGGGMTSGNPELIEARALRFCAEAGCVVIQVDYRLAPEFPYPHGFNDCYGILLWIAANVAMLGIDPHRLAIGGESAGGNLALSCALRARNENGPPICFLMPLYPMINDRQHLASDLENFDPRILDRTKMDYFWNAYLGENRADVPIYAAPYRETDFSALPPTYTIVGTVDPFRDAVIEWVQRLAQQGIPITFQLIHGCYHGFELEFPQLSISEKTSAAIVDALIEGLKTDL